MAAAIQPGAGRQPAWIMLVAALAFFAALIGANRPVFALDAPASFADLAAKVSPAVVNISTTQTVHTRTPDVPDLPPGSPFEEFFKDFFDHQGGQERDRKMQSLGSGFIISADGVIVTNNHVVDDADEIVVKTQDGTEYKAKLLGKDKPTDLAVLKIDSSKPLPYVEFGNSDNARVGDWVMAIGNPYGLGGTVTVGIVSARSRQIEMGPYDDFIQTDAAINRGNSGGPLLTLDGKVVGINSAIYSPTGGSIGIGFSIPSDQARPIIEQLEKGGKVMRGWLGVSLQPMTKEIAESLGLKDDKGALVAGVVDGDPAQKGGIRSGDVILSFNTKPVKDASDLSRIVADTAIGKSVDVVVWRGGKERTLSVNLVERQEDKVAATENPSKPTPTPSEDHQTVAGMELSALTPDLRKSFDIGDDVEGVIVTNVENSSDAADKGVTPGVVITQIGQDEATGKVTTPQQVQDKIDALKKDDQKFVLLRVYVQGRYLWVPVQLAQG
jgi:serine protease Do